VHRSKGSDEVNSSEYTARTNKHGQTVIIRTEESHLPHISVSWYLAGMWESGNVAVQPGETREQAAHRAYGNRARKTELQIRDIVWID